MSTLQISLFGCVQVTHSDPAVRVGKLTHTVQTMLAFFLLERHRLHPREALAGRFWGDYDTARARHCLNTTLWRLRRVLEPDGISPGTYLTTNHRGDVGFNCDASHWLDVEVFEGKISAGLKCPAQTARESQIVEIENAVNLYAGDLLEGLYEDWVLRDREHLRRLYLNALTYLIQHYKHHRAYQKCLEFGQAILDQDPLREDVHREMMRLYVQSGQRPLAIRQYENCCAILEEELGVGAMEETQSLFHLLLSDHPNEVEHGTSPAALTDVLPAVSLLKEVAESLASTQAELKRALQMIEVLTRQQRPDNGIVPVDTRVTGEDDVTSA